MDQNRAWSRLSTRNHPMMAPLNIANINQETEFWKAALSAGRRSSGAVCASRAEWLGGKFRQIGKLISRANEHQHRSLVASVFPRPAIEQGEGIHLSESQAKHCQTTRRKQTHGILSPTLSLTSKEGRRQRTVPEFHLQPRPALWLRPGQNTNSFYKTVTTQIRHCFKLRQ